MSWEEFNMKVGLFEMLTKLKICRSRVIDSSGHGSPGLRVKEYV